MSKQDMVKAFCEYWGISEQDVREVGTKFDRDVKELHESIETCKTAEERSALEERIENLSKEFSRMYHMVYMTASSYGVVNQLEKRSVRSNGKVASIAA